MDERGQPPAGSGAVPGTGRDSFLAWTKARRAEELLSRLPEEARRGWTFDRLVQLLEALGLSQPRQYLEAGWWVPEAVRRDPPRSEALYQRVQEAMAAGRIPPADARYTWDDVRRLVELCGFTADELLTQLAYVYALTMGETIFVETASRVAAAGGATGDARAAPASAPDPVRSGVADAGAPAQDPAAPGGRGTGAADAGAPDRRAAESDGGNLPQRERESRPSQSAGTGQATKPTGEG